MTAALDCVAEGWPDTYQPLRALRECATAARFAISVCSARQFKRGKNTFINALLGAAVLRSAVLPLTAISTFIGWGPAPLLRATYKGECATEELQPQGIEHIQEALHSFVTEEANPNNARWMARARTVAVLIH